jgi:integrase
LEGDEEQRLMAAAGPHLQAVIVCALEAGLRRGEILGLQFGMLSGDVITLPASLTKTSRARAVPITSRLAAMIEMRRNAPDGKAHPADKYVFGDAFGLQIASVSTAWRATCRRAGVVGLHLHDLRRESASRLLEIPGISLHDVREVLGHQNVSTTSRYLATSAARLRHVRDLVERSRQAEPVGIPWARVGYESLSKPS